MIHPVETASAVSASLVAVAFAMSTFERWLARRRSHELAWTAALGMFAVAAGAMAAGAQLGWDAGVFRLYYLFGAIVDVPVLALGSVYLLAGTRIGHRVALGVGAFALFAVGVLVSAPLRAPVPGDRLAQGSKVFGPLPRVLAGVGSGGGAVVIFVAAAWSALRLWRRRDGAGRMVWANVLIAGGTLVLGASGTLNSAFGAMTAFAVSLLVGIAVLFCGFLLTSSPAGTTGPRPPVQMALGPAQPAADGPVDGAGRSSTPSPTDSPSS